MPGSRRSARPFISSSPTIRTRRYSLRRAASDGHAVAIGSSDRKRAACVSHRCGPRDGSSELCAARENADGPAGARPLSIARRSSQTPSQHRSSSNGGSDKVLANRRGALKLEPPHDQRRPAFMFGRASRRRRCASRSARTQRRSPLALSSQPSRAARCSFRAQVAAPSGCSRPRQGATPDGASVPIVLHGRSCRAHKAQLGWAPCRVSSTG